jgi:hypothetical protein
MIVMIEEINGRWTCTDCGYEWSACMGDDEVPEECECKYEGSEVTVKVSPFQIESLWMICDFCYKNATPNNSGCNQGHIESIHDLTKGLQKELDKSLKSDIVEPQ